MSSSGAIHLSLQLPANRWLRSIPTCEMQVGYASMHPARWDGQPRSRNFQKIVWMKLTDPDVFRLANLIKISTGRSSRLQLKPCSSSQILTNSRYLVLQLGYSHADFFGVAQGNFRGVCGAMLQIRTRPRF